MAMSPDRKRLIELVRELSYREGDFTLASGQKSSFYIDLKATTLHPEGAKMIGKVAVQTLIHELGEGATRALAGVGGLTLGADPIATAVSLAAFDQGLHWPAFIVRKEAKAHGTERYLEGAENLKPGGSLVVLEDVVTTGGSSQKAIDRLIDAGFKVSTVLTVVDREQGGSESFLARGIPLIRLATITEVRSLGN